MVRKKSVVQFSLATNATRLRNDHAQDKKLRRDGGHRAASRLAEAAETVQHLKNEPRNAVYRSLHDGSHDQALLRMRAYASGDRALAQDGQRGTAGGDGAAPGADGGRRARVHRAAPEARLIDAAAGAAP